MQLYCSCRVAKKALLMFPLKSQQLNVLFLQAYLQQWLLARVHLNSGEECSSVRYLTTCDRKIHKEQIRMLYRLAKISRDDLSFWKILGDLHLDIHYEQFLCIQMRWLSNTEVLLFYSLLYHKGDRWWC